MFVQIRLSRNVRVIAVEAAQTDLSAQRTHLQHRLDAGVDEVDELQACRVVCKVIPVKKGVPSDSVSFMDTGAGANSISSRKSMLKISLL